MAKILLIEDNREILDSNQIMLELEGYEVITAETVGAGKKLALSENPDLIILDIMLPDGNGVELCKELKSERDFSVIFLSALGTQKDVLEGLRAGGFDYISKPYIMEELLLRVNNILRMTAPMVHNDFTIGSIRLKPYSSVAEYKGTDLLLKTKEYAVLDLLCRNAGKFVSTDSILECVWNNKEASMQPLYNCLSALRDKLNETDVNITFKRGTGYMITAEGKD